jgi:hypothetical protein
MATRRYYFKRNDPDLEMRLLAINTSRRDIERILTHPKDQAIPPGYAPPDFFGDDAWIFIEEPSHG